MSVFSIRYSHGIFKLTEKFKDLSFTATTLSGFQ